MITTIQIDTKLKEKIDKLKIHERESYNEVIQRMVEECKHIKVDEQSLRETIDILSDPKTLRDIAESLNDFERGKFVELK
jgi:PHD/YefM family antitoxin component YafN of YafNO toxin-antitoxin module